MVTFPTNYLKVSNPKEKFLLLLELTKRSREEKSTYARLVFQENIIAILIITALQTIELFLNKTIGRATITKERKFQIDYVIQIKFDSDKLEEETLGRLSTMLYSYLVGDQELMSSLKEFTALRNDITHKMFTKFTNIEQLETESKKAVMVGEKIIKALHTFIDKLDSSLKVGL